MAVHDGDPLSGRESPDGIPQLVVASVIGGRPVGNGIRRDGSSPRRAVVIDRLT